MSALKAEQIQSLLSPYVARPLGGESLERIVRYLATFSVWSRRMNLSTVTDPEQVVQRHFGEGLALAQVLPSFTTALDLGSGAGFPGLPLALARPGAAVTLAESQKKKAAFLKEACWMMGLSATVWPDRAEALPPGTVYDVVALRAVDRMSEAIGTAHTLLRPGGTLAFFTGEQESIRLPEGDWAQVRSFDVPRSPGSIVLAQLQD